MAKRAGLRVQGLLKACDGGQVEDLELSSLLFMGTLLAVILLLLGEPVCRLVHDCKLRRKFKLRDQADALNNNER